ncbi:MAG: hypothetical protein FJW29_10630 [Acidobacteria bacterium]|nr:hypothetical protein [Acidobacteriota bacterium]
MRVGSVQMVSRVCAVLLVAALGGAVRGQVPAGQAREPFPGTLDDHPVIGYADTLVHDRVARLNDALADGRVALATEGPTGVLRSLLAALDVPESSQLLVFSKTALQSQFTGPATPRALYYNDAVVVGYIASSPVIEVAALDPKQGVQFYTIEPPPSGQPWRLARTPACLNCHLAQSTLDIPGFIVRSHQVDRAGRPLLALGVTQVDMRTPHPQRWGGWFVTGASTAPPYGPLGHMGNLVHMRRPDEGPEILADMPFRAWLGQAPEARRYLSEQSDISALLTFDHQMPGLNLITRLQWEARVAAYEGRALETDPAIVARREALADYLLGVGEAPFDFSVTPRADFARALIERFPRDGQGRSLAELDLTKRLLKYGVSFLVYTQAFAALPREVRLPVMARIMAVLDGRVTAPKYAHLRPGERLAARIILRDTHPDVRGAWAEGR